MCRAGYRDSVGKSGYRGALWLRVDISGFSGRGLASTCFARRGIAAGPCIYRSGSGGSDGRVVALAMGWPTDAALVANLRSTREIVVWDEVKDELDRRIRQVMTDLTEATDIRAIGFQQGKLHVLQEMVNLPRAMMAQGESDAAEAKERLVIQQSQDPRSWTNPHTEGK